MGRGANKFSGRVRTLDKKEGFRGHQPAGLVKVLVKRLILLIVGVLAPHCDSVESGTRDVRKDLVEREEEGLLSPYIVRHLFVVESGSGPLLGKQETIRALARLIVPRVMPYFTIAQKIGIAEPN